MVKTYWKEHLNTLKELSEDRETSIEKKKKIRELIRNKDKFLKHFVGFFGGSCRETQDLFIMLEQKKESEEKSIIKNSQITKEKKEQLLKEIKKFYNKLKKDVEEINNLNWDNIKKELKGGKK